MKYTQPYCLQGITTKYLGPTDHRGSRIVAQSGGGQRLVVPWDDALDIFPNHQRAALALASKLGWAGPWIGGATRTGYAFVSAKDAVLAHLEQAYALTLTADGGTKRGDIIRTDIGKLIDSVGE